MEQKIAPGIYKGRGIAGSEQYGCTSNNNDQIAVDLALKDIGEQVTTFLVFTEKSAEYSIERLRAMGWEGDDLSNLAGLDRNEVDVEVKYEEYQGKMQMRVQVLTGGGRVVLQNAMDDKAKKAFAARFRGLAVSSRGSSKPQGASGDMAGGGFPFGRNAPQQQGGVKL